MSVKPLIPVYGTLRGKASRFPLYGSLSILCIAAESIVIWFVAINFLKSETAIAPTVILLPLAGLVTGATGMAYSRLRSVTAWIGTVLNLAILTLYIYVQMLGAGQA